MFESYANNRNNSYAKVICGVLVLCLAVCIVGATTRGWLKYDKDGVKMSFGLWDYCIDSAGVEECHSKSDFDTYLKNNDPSLYHQTNLCRAMIIMECVVGFLAILFMAGYILNFITDFTAKTYGTIFMSLAGIFACINFLTFLWIHEKIKPEDTRPSLYYDWYLEAVVCATYDMCIWVIKKNGCS
eukprot:TRINITY_DN8904_c0_g1_i1.p1 TRINITY_DN8904_c0_g1~~TRINITY_DN8904_c0_g1_i1.p1  ORF type:complete len:185 (-),score=17.86 TRINITY_DN8904_c0_g1_i1:263-817(-)